MVMAFPQLMLLLGVTSGRPYGGVGFLWKKCLDASVSVIEFVFDWLCGIKAKMYAISSDTHQLRLIKLHHFKLERFKSI